MPNKQTDRRRTGFRLSVLTLALVISGCTVESAEDKAGGAPAMPPASVSTLEIQRQDVPLQFEYVGQVAASREVEVHARVTGIVEKRSFDEGGRVEQGQELFRIEPSTYEYQLAQAEAELVSARAALKQAEREYRRIKPLVGKRLASQNQLDDADSARELAAASVKLAQARVKSAWVNLDYTRVTAPISGTVGRALQVEGGLAEVGGSSLLTRIAQTDPVYVNFGIAEGEQLELQEEIRQGRVALPEAGYQVNLLSSDGTSLGHTGRVDFRDYKVDNRTGNFSLRATFANPEGRLSPGQFVRVQLNGAERQQAVILPQRAVLDDAKGKYVYVATKSEKGAMVAMKRPVQVGEWLNQVNGIEHAWVIRSGLEPGDQVVVDGTARIFFPGMPINPTPLQPAAEKPLAAN